MKTIYSLALLCLMGCGGKPKPVNQTAHIPDPHCDAAQLCVDMTSGIYVIQEGPVKVTPEQWRAAQGLYRYYSGACRGVHQYPCRTIITKVGNTNDSIDTFPHSGDAK